MLSRQITVSAPGQLRDLNQCSMSIFLCLCLCLCLSFNLSLSLFVSLSLSLFVCLPFSVWFCFSVSLSLFLFLCCLCFCLSVCLSTLLSFLLASCSCSPPLWSQGGSCYSGSHMHSQSSQGEGQILCCGPISHLMSVPERVTVALGMAWRSLVACPFSKWG